SIWVKALARFDQRKLRHGACAPRPTDSGKPAQRRFANKFPGGHRGRVTPVPIPNTEVKPATADGTACVGAWESRSLPGVKSAKIACAISVYLRNRFPGFGIQSPRH